MQVNSDDIERITCLIPGVYTLCEATDEARRVFDLNIYEYTINAHVQDAIQRINNIIQMVN